MEKELMQGGFVKVTEAARVYDERSYYGPHQRLELSIEIPEDGMLVAELTHQADEDVEIYFDDFSFNQLQEGFEVLQRMDYYPFGMPMAHSYKNDTRSQNRYWYNAGSRYNDSTGHYQMHYRHYDATLGRFNVVDPYANEFANLSPYNYGGNNPIMYNDPSGGRMYPNPDHLRSWRELASGGGGLGGGPMHSIGPGSGFHWSDGFGGSYGGGSYGSSGGGGAGYSGGNLTIDFNNIGRFGGQWSADGGYSDFRSSIEAGIAFASYNSLHGSWGATIFGDYNTFADSYNEGAGATVFMPERQVNTYGRKCFSCNSMINQNGGTTLQAGFGPGDELWNTISNTNNGVGFVVGGASESLGKYLHGRANPSNLVGWNKTTGTSIKTLLIKGAAVNRSLLNGAANTLRVGGAVLGGVGVVMTGAEIISGQKSLVGEGGLDLIMGGVAFIPGGGWIVSGAYFGGKALLEYTGNDFWNKK
ncbi:hypothetical protein GCM10011506_18930 [Marivirga lumbricoides]|uniref:RHS repeat-associated core domain-containing protein n=1 Tax=Marivirga lumbricoides TaxID=1046115 RepID=A0ABQ1M2J9_9BACT|nr:hypothetical protein GCM10011506_18930 [Marivirga lumbricoides]